MVGKCIHPECDREEKLTKGLCRKHYMRLYRNGGADILRGKPLRGDGRRKHFMYGAWAGMVNRCHNPNNSSFHRYGGKGIFVCDEWRSDFTAFLRDMGERPDGMTLDRVDPKGPYSKANCRWATASQQRLNWSEEGRASNVAAIRKGIKNYWSGDRSTASRVLTKSKKETMNYVVQIRCTDEQREQIAKAAELSGDTVSDWIRKTAMAAARRGRRANKGSADETR